MSIREVFSRLLENNNTAFMPFFQAGFPSVNATINLLKTAEKNGADIIELGIPFSDPIADGPVIQEASYLSLKKGFRINEVFNILNKAKLKIPVALMTYYNPVCRYGIDRFISHAVRAGASGLIIPDLPIGEGKGFRKVIESSGLDTIFFAAPTSGPGRIKKIADAVSGFIYYVSVTGVTGARKELAHSLIPDLKRLKSVTDKPVAVGFGISTPAQASAISRVADGIIVGSAIVKTVLQFPSSYKVKIAKYIRYMKKACVRKK
jgi:tryptophan synthase alpha chain